MPSVPNLKLKGKRDESGFGEVVEYIQKNITGKDAALQKLQNSHKTAEQILERISDGIATRKQQWSADRNFMDDIYRTLDQESGQAFKQAKMLTENLVISYQQVVLETEMELRSGFSFWGLLKRSVSSIFSKKESLAEWLKSLKEKMEESLNRSLRDRLLTGVYDLAESIQQMGRIVDLKLRNSQTILKDNHEIFASIAERRSQVLKELQENFEEFLKYSENFKDDALFDGSAPFSPNVATGTGIAIVGAILTGLTNGVVFDVTGGILTAIGLLFAGVSAGVQKRKVLKGYREEVSKGKMKLEQELNENLNGYISNIGEKIKENFNEFIAHLEAEEMEITRLESQAEIIQEQLDSFFN